MDTFLLTDAMGSVGGLVFHTLVPPWVKVNDGVGAGEIKADAAGFERDEKDRDFFLIEAVDQLHAILAFGFPCEGDIGNAALVKLWRNHIKHTGELTENEHLMAGCGAVFNDREAE